MPTPEEVISAILGSPPQAQPPSFVPDVARRRAALERQSVLSYRPFRNVRATPAPGPPPPVNRVGTGCRICGLPTSPCCCPTR